MRIRWTTDALNDLTSHINYIQKENSSAARQVAASLSKLLVFPDIGRPGERKGTRELVEKPYVIVYRVKDETIELLHIFHGSQDWK